MNEGDWSMETLRELMTERPLKITGRGPRPEWTVSIKNVVQGSRLLDVDAKSGSLVSSVIGAVSIVRRKRDC